MWLFKGLKYFVSCKTGWFNFDLESNFWLVSSFWKLGFHSTGTFAVSTDSWLGRLVGLKFTHQGRASRTGSVGLSHLEGWAVDFMMMSSNGNIFGVTGPLCGEFTGHLWIPLTEASGMELWCFLWSVPWINGWVNNRDAGALRHCRARFDVIVMLPEDSNE